MITWGDIPVILTWCAGFAADKAPQPSEAVQNAWASHFEDFPKLEMADVQQAVKQYFREPHERLVQPADITKLARAIRQDRVQRETDEERQAFEDAWDAELLARNKARLAALIAPVAESKGITEGETA